MTNLTREAFERDPRAKELRTICLEIAGSVDNIVEQKNGAWNGMEWNIIQRLYERLIGMEISPTIKAGLDASAYEHPLTMAEYVAGQWVERLNKIHSWEELQGDFIFMRSYVNMTYRFLDAD